MFLPADLKSRVTDDYIPFISWNFVQSISGTVTGTLSTQALLLALGMDSLAASGLAGTMNWIIKDGFGLLGGVIFAGFIISSPKRYRFVSNCLIQASTILEILAPMVPTLFLPLASMCNIGKNVGWLATSATRAAIHRGFTRSDNLAKAGAQGTAAGLVGTGLGILVGYCTATSSLVLYSSFVGLSLVNILAAYMSCRSVVTRTLNQERAERVIQAYLRDTLLFTGPGIMASPREIASLENLILPHSTSILLEPDLDVSLLDIEPNNDLYQILVKNGQIKLWYLSSASTRDIVQGFAVAVALQYASKHGLDLDLDRVKSVDWTDLLKQSGWELDHHHLSPRNARITRD